MERKYYSNEFKLKIVMDILKETKTLKEVALDYNIHPNQIRRWKAEVEALGEFYQDYLNENIENIKAEYEIKIKGLYAEIGCLFVELSELKNKA